MSEIQVFLSHAAEDAQLAYPIREKLEERGIRVFDPHRDLLPGGSFQREIERAIDDATVFLLIFSPHSATSRWSEYEYRAFQEKMLTEGNDRQRALIPLLAPDGSAELLPRPLRQFQSIRADAVDAIVDATLRYVSTPPEESFGRFFHPTRDLGRPLAGGWVWGALFFLLGILFGWALFGR